MHDLLLVGIAVSGTLAAFGARRLLAPRARRRLQEAAERHIAREASKQITLDDFEPTEKQADEIRRAVADFDRQRTPLTFTKDRQGIDQYDYSGPRDSAGRLFGLVYQGRIVMFYQWRGGRMGEDPNPVKAALNAFWRGFPDAVDTDGWPVKPERIFEINPGVYAAPGHDFDMDSVLTRSAQFAHGRSNVLNEN